MADHFSGPRALADPASDITDVFAFPSPERPGHLVLVLDVFPVAPPRRCSPTRSRTASGCGR
jgi:Domain of unknown function (DUF4331)